MKRRFGMVIVVALAIVTIGYLAAVPAQEKGTQPGKKDAEARQQLLETVGALAAGHLYQSYLNIGLIADGRAEGVYEEKDIQQIFGSVLSLMETLDKQLDKISKLDLNKEDRDGVEQIRKLSATLRQQADELQAFWKTGDKERGAKYEKLRKESWEGISKMLGLDK